MQLASNGIEKPIKARDYQPQIRRSFHSKITTIWFSLSCKM